MESLNQFLLAELKAALLEQYGRIKFPFENVIDYLNKDISRQLNITIQILQCIDSINESFVHKY